MATVTSMTNRSENGLRAFQAIIWSKEPSSVGQRITVIAEDVSQAREKIQAEYGSEIICSLWNEGDANAPR